MGRATLVGMRTRVVTVAAFIAAAASLVVVVWVRTRPNFALPPGVHGHRPHWYQLVPPIAWTLTGTVLVWVRPRNRVSRLVLFVGVCQSLAQASSAYGMYGVGIANPHWPAAQWVAFFGAPLWVPGYVPLFTVLLAIYPDGRLPGRRWRLPVAAVVLGIAMLTLLMTGGYNDVAPGPMPITFAPPGPVRAAVLGLTALSFLGGSIAIWAMTVLRVAHARPPERQLLAWLLCAVIPFFTLSFFNSAALVLSIWTAALPVAITVGVLRYRLLGIEVVLRRGLVYAVLTAAVITVYLAVTAVAGSQLGHGSVTGVVAAGLLAVGLTPIRDHVQRAVDRLVYGDRRDPVRAVTRFADSLAVPGEADDLLAAVLKTVTRAVRAPGAVVLSVDGRVLAAHGPDAAALALPLSFAGHDVGTLRVAERTPGERYTDADHKLLGALAAQVAVVVRALDLAEALESERDRVLAATRAERDRLRRDLHDGLGPSLSGVGLGLQALQTAISSGDEPTAAELLDRVRAEASSAVGEVRRILDDLRPAALDELGLPGAVRRHADAVGAGVPVVLDVAGVLPPLAAEVETAAFRIAQEALTNVVRHADASQARLALAVTDGSLRVEVTDDGRGFPDAPAEGVGLGSMRHRAETLGGSLEVTTGDDGTTVVAMLPFQARR